LLVVVGSNCKSQARETRSLLTQCRLPKAWSSAHGTGERPLRCAPAGRRAPTPPVSLAVAKRPRLVLAPLTGGPALGCGTDVRREDGAPVHATGTRA